MSPRDAKVSGASRSQEERKKKKKRHRGRKEEASSSETDSSSGGDRGSRDGRRAEKRRYIELHIRSEFSV